MLPRPPAFRAVDRLLIRDGTATWLDVDDQGDVIDVQTEPGTRTLAEYGVALDFGGRTLDDDTTPQPSGLRTAITTGTMGTC